VTNAGRDCWSCCTRTTLDYIAETRLLEVRHDLSMQLESIDPMAPIIRLGYYRQRRLSHLCCPPTNSVCSTQLPFVVHGFLCITVLCSARAYIESSTPRESLLYTSLSASSVQVRIPFSTFTNPIHIDPHQSCATATQSSKPARTATLQNKSSNSRASAPLAFLHQRSGGSSPVSYSRRFRSRNLATHAPASSTGLMISLPLLLSFH